jgi:PiT family inorganic phosphate transporter
MGLIMLILIGTVPTAYALNRALPESQIKQFTTNSAAASNVSEAIRFLMKDKERELNNDEIAVLNSYKGSLDATTKFIPTWVKIAVAIALGLGTMIGWKRIVITVGEKIGKTHLTYAQGACAEITAAATIAAADGYGLPVSTTHVLSSGIAGTMAASGSGLQWSTIRNIALAWVLTLPAAMMISGSLYLLFSKLL